MDAFRNDIRHAICNLIKRPGFMLIAVLTPGIDIGANSAIFSAIHALLLKPLPFPELDRVVAVWDKIPPAPELMSNRLSHSVSGAEV